jgi:hypothetical protein
MNPLILWCSVVFCMVLLIGLCFRAGVPSLREICTWIARTCAMLSYVCLHLATLCKNGCVTCLAGTEQAETERNELAFFCVGAAIARIIYFVTSSIIVIAVFPFDRLRTAALYGLVAEQLNLPLDVLTGLLWMLVPGVWLLLLLESLSLLPAWARLFPHLHARKGVTIGVGILAAILSLLSLVVTFFFHVYGQCQVLQLTCATNASLQVYTVGLFGVLLACSAVIGLFGIMLGLTGLAGCVLGLLYCGLFLLHLVCGLIGSCFVGFSPSHTAPIPVLFSPSGADRDQTLPLLLSTVRQDVSPTFIEEDIMDTLRTTTVIGYGACGYRFVPLFLEIAQMSGAAATLLAAGMVDVERIYRNETPLSIAGCKDISPSIKQITKTLAEASGDDIYTSLACAISEEIVNAYSTKHGGTIIISAPLLLVPALYEPLRRLKVRLPNQHVVLAVWLPPTDQQDHLFQAAYEDTLSLADAEGEANGIQIVAFDPADAFAREYGEEVHERALATTQLDLSVGPLHDERNVTFAEVGKRLIAYSPLTGMKFAIASVAHGKSPLLWKVVKAVAPRAGDRGFGDANDLLIQAKECTKQVVQPLTSTDTTAIASPTAPVFVVYTVPVPLADKRFKEFVASITTWLKRTYPNVTAIVVKGTAPATPAMIRGYRCGVTACYPLSVVESVVHAEPDNKALQEEVQREEMPATPTLNGVSRRGRKPKES